MTAVYSKLCATEQSSIYLADKCNFVQNDRECCCRFLCHFCARVESNSCFVYFRFTSLQLSNCDSAFLWYFLHSRESLQAPCWSGGRNAARESDSQDVTLFVFCPSCCELIVQLGFRVVQPLAWPVSLLI